MSKPKQAARQVTAKLILLLGIAGLLTACGAEEALTVARSLPQYPGASFLHDFKTGFPDGSPSGGVVYTSGDTPAQIQEYFVAAFPAQGWTLIQVDDYGAGSTPNHLVFHQTAWKCQILIDKESPHRITVTVQRQ